MDERSGANRTCRNFQGDLGPASRDSAWARAAMRRVPLPCTPPQHLEPLDDDLEIAKPSTDSESQ